MAESAPGRIDLLGEHADGFVLISPAADQAVSLLARAEHALLLDKRGMAVEHIPFDLAAEELTLLVIDTRVRVEQRDNDVSQRARHVVTENERVEEAVYLLRDKQIRKIAPLLNASHRSLRFDYGVTVDEWDVAVEAALAGGALGARMTGVGGCVIALADVTHAAVCASAVRMAFATRRFAEPCIWPTSAGPGAHR